MKTTQNWAARRWKPCLGALEAIAQRGDPSVMPQVAAARGDVKDVVRFTAAACVAHLSQLPAKESPAKTANP
jgi:hypothetical protein